MNVVGKRYLFLGISGAAVLVSVILLLTVGLNLGIDFRGGTLLERGLPGNAKVTEVQDALKSNALAKYDLGKSFVQPLEESTSEKSVVLIRTRAFEDSTPIGAIDDVLKERFGDVTVRRTELVGPVIGQELVNQALIALTIAALGIMAYVSIRFEYRFGVAALIALLHDVLITLGVLALLGREINTPFIAAILTVVGYSINDTIVIFDRIRENLNHRRRETLTEVVNSSINQTLARSINTSLTTILVILSLYLFGGSSIKDFTLTLLVGIMAGTYSSIFVASPIWFNWKSTTEHKPARAA